MTDHNADKVSLTKAEFELFETIEDAVGVGALDDDTVAQIARYLAASGYARTEKVLEDAGLAKRYRLVGHPAYPDPLNIWPPTEENAARYHERYCTDTFEEYRKALGHTPPGLTAERFNPRVLVVWEHVGEKQVFTPVKEATDD